MIARGIVAAIGFDALLGGIVWFALADPRAAGQRTVAIALMWAGAWLLARLIRSGVTADKADRGAHVRPDGPYEPQVGDDVWIRSHAATFRVCDVTAGGLVTVTNLNSPMSRTTLPASWVRPVPYVRRKVTR